MVEAGAAKADKAEFSECWQTTWKTPYIMRLALSAGIGGLLFGYDTGNSRHRLPYCSNLYEEDDNKNNDVIFTFWLDCIVLQV